MADDAPRWELEKAVRDAQDNLATLADRLRKVDPLLNSGVVTITKAQLRRLVDAAVHDCGNYSYIGRCGLCNEVVLDGHAPDCELEHLRKLSE